MTIATHAHDDVTTLELTGALTIVDGVRNLREEIARLMEGGHNRLAVDLRHVPDIDSAGLGELVSAHVEAIRQRGEFSLLNVPAHVKRMLEVTRLATVLRCQESVC